MVLLCSILIRKVCVRIRMNACEPNGVIVDFTHILERGECQWAACSSARWLCLSSNTSVLDQMLLLFTRCSLKCWNELASPFCLVWALCESLQLPVNPFVKINHLCGCVKELKANSVVLGSAPALLLYSAFLCCCSLLFLVL